MGNTINSSGNVSPTSAAKSRAKASGAEPQSDMLALTGDALALSSGATTKASSGEAIADEIVTLALTPGVERAQASLAKDLPDLEISVPFRRPPLSIEQVRFADLAGGGREYAVSAGQPHLPLPPFGVNPVTGQHDVALREMVFWVAGGGYELKLKLDGNGRLGIDDILKDGKDVTDIAKDALKAKFQEDPVLVGALASVAVAGAAYYLNDRAGRTGKPFSFNAVSATLYETDSLKVKGRLNAELTGGKSFVRPGSASLRVDYTAPEGNLSAFAEERYRFQDKSLETSVGVDYSLKEDAKVTARAFHNSKTNQSGGAIEFNARF
ncbi:hypothetical protein J7643_16355 [bacterium]|nr:hypothetical protein [bacterium]